MKSGKISPVLYIILGVSLGLLGFFLLLANPFGWKLPIPTLIKLPSTNPTNQSVPKGLVSAPTPYLILPHGKQTYNARGTENGRSKVISIIYDPLDPSLNANQTISADIESSETIKTVNLTVHTDNQSNTHLMKLSSGTLTKGVWTTTFQAVDTYDKIYDVSFEIITELGNKSTIPMLIR